MRSLRTVALACAELGVRVEFERDMRSLPVRYRIFSGSQCSVQELGWHSSSILRPYGFREVTGRAK